jgi:hypothetical protein
MSASDMLFRPNIYWMRFVCDLDHVSSPDASLGQANTNPSAHFSLTYDVDTLALAAARPTDIIAATAGSIRSIPCRVMGEGADCGQSIFGSADRRTTGRCFQRLCARLLPWKIQDLHGVSTIAEVTYYVALPFVVTDDGIAAGEPVECFNPNAVVMRAEALSR